MFNLFNKKQQLFSKTVLTEEFLACQNINAPTEKMCFAMINVWSEDKKKLSVGDTAKTVVVFNTVCMVTAESCNQL